MYFLGLSLIASLAIFSFSSFKNLESSIKTLDKAQEEDYLVVGDVITDLNALGANSTTAPDDWNPPAGFTGYHSVYHYDLAGDLYSVFVWDSPLNDDFLTAGNDCTHKWYSNGDCKDKAKDCEVTVENGKTVIICCDDE